MHALLARWRNYLKIMKIKSKSIFLIFTARNKLSFIRFDSTQLDVKIEFKTSFLNFENSILERVEYE